MGKTRNKGPWSGAFILGKRFFCVLTLERLEYTQGEMNRSVQWEMCWGKAQISGVRGEVFESRFSCRDGRETASPYSFQGPDLVLLHTRHLELFFFFFFFFFAKVQILTQQVWAVGIRGRVPQ